MRDINQPISKPGVHGLTDPVYDLYFENHRTILSKSSVDLYSKWRKLVRSKFVMIYNQMFYSKCFMKKSKKFENEKIWFIIWYAANHISSQGSPDRSPQVFISTCPDSCRDRKFFTPSSDGFRSKDPYFKQKLIEEYKLAGIERGYGLPVSKMVDCCQRLVRSGVLDSGRFSRWCFELRFRLADRVRLSAILISWKTSSS